MFVTRGTGKTGQVCEYEKKKCYDTSLAQVVRIDESDSYTPALDFLLLHI